MSDTTEVALAWESKFTMNRVVEWWNGIVERWNNGMVESTNNPVPYTITHAHLCSVYVYTRFVVLSSMKLRYIICYLITGADPGGVLGVR